MVALGGLVFASLQPLREQTRFRTARDRIDAVVREARELAMRSGEPVVLAFDPVTGRLSVTGLEPDGAAERENAAEQSPPAIDLLLDPRLRLTARPPSGDADAASAVPRDAAAVAVTPDTSWMDRPFEPWRLAVFLPDGTLLLARAAWLGRGGTDAEAEDRAAGEGDDEPSPSWRLTIHPWTGEPSWTDAAAAAVFAVDEPAADEPAQDPGDDASFGDDAEPWFEAGDADAPWTEAGP